MEYRPEIEVFLQDLETIAYDLSKSLMIDANLLKYKPSILSITLVFAGFQLQFELWQQKGKLTLDNKEGRELVWQICQVFKFWRFNLLEELLKVKELPKVILFCEHVINR